MKSSHAAPHNQGHSNPSTRPGQLHTRPPVRSAIRARSHTPRMRTAHRLATTMASQRSLSLPRAAQAIATSGQGEACCGGWPRQVVWERGPSRGGPVRRRKEWDQLRRERPGRASWSGWQWAVWTTTKITPPRCAPHPIGAADRAEPQCRCHQNQVSVSSESDGHPISAATGDRWRPLGRALARRRRVSLSLIQLTYIAAAAILGALLSRIQVGSVPANKATQLLFAIALGVLPLMGIAYSLLFLVVQWGASQCSLPA
jgi:hypothetical protein